MSSFSSKWFAIPLFASIFVLSGCGSSGVTITDDSVNVQPSSGQGAVRFGENVAIPTDFPADIPQYPGAKTQVVLHDVAQKTYTINQQTSDDLTTVRAALENPLLAQGFQKTMDLSSADTIVTGYEKGNIKYSFQLSRDAAKGLTYTIVVRAEH